MESISDLKYEYEKKQRVLDNLKKNYERRKKLNLAEPDYERQIKADIRTIESELSYLARKMRGIESEQTRKRIINESKN